MVGSATGFFLYTNIWCGKNYGRREQQVVLTAVYSKLTSAETNVDDVDVHVLSGLSGDQDDQTGNVESPSL
ncbi:hypothetical protein FQA47_000224 [Oryzias melastigma]|uniref:Uncharacterized protein n=1 Tax=Oryzias melastigma TaxID=30732 RepID=A0A834F906_ORYME|nr:hypothetical protein FQA47_000224 [Oryzias melastigma]